MAKHKTPPPWAENGNGSGDDHTASSRGGGRGDGYGRKHGPDPETLRVVRAVWRATDGRPQAWRGLDGLGLSEDSIGVQRAVDGGLLLIEGGHSVCLTDEGRRLGG